MGRLRSVPFLDGSDFGGIHRNAINTSNKIEEGNRGLVKLAFLKLETDTSFLETWASCSSWVSE